jgi:serine/threonine protein kinase
LLTPQTGITWPCNREIGARDLQGNNETGGGRINHLASSKARQQATSSRRHGDGRERFFSMDQALARLGEFDITRELGRGGMGVVYEAVQTSLGRRVALKVLGPGLGLTPRAVDRFRREAEAAAKLHHTNIVPVYSTGEQDGVHFYAMELVDGPSLEGVIRKMRLNARHATPADAADGGVTSAYVPIDPLLTLPSGTPSGGSSSAGFDRIAGMVADVADALHHAHQNGVTHRDIKPSNLMLSSDGRLSVTDFGLARMLEQPGVTATGEFVGTPAYMSPEQITAGRIPVDHRTDIYSLGATLYELLTLRPPFAADGRDKLLAMVIQKDPLPPRSVDAKVPRDLETICLKCLEKDPDRRYMTAKELADDLRRYVNRFAILAKRTGPLGKMRKWAARNPALSAALLLALLALGGVGFFAWRSHEAEQRRLADEQTHAQEFATERRRAAMERGMTAALAADLPAAAKAVDEAELLGASWGEIRLLRGFIALRNGNPAEAVEHLQQAIRHMPKSVSAHALLASALASIYDWPAAYRALDEAAALPLQTPQDKLFLGSAIAETRPEEGLKLMDEALKGRPVGIGHVLRAFASMTRALHSGTIADADAALADAELVKRFMPDNPSSLSLAANCEVCAAVAYRRAGRPEEWDKHLAAAGREAEALLRYPDSQDAVQIRVHVANIRDGLAGQVNSLDELRRAQKAKKNAALACEEAMALFILGRDEEAAKIAGEFPNHRSNLFVSYLVALGRREGKDAACQIARRLTAPGEDASFRLESAPLLLAAGTPDEFTALARTLRADGNWPRLAQYGAEDELRFLEGGLTETELLSRPLPGQKDWARPHSTVAWKRLGSGDRQGAEGAFRETYEAMVTWSARWWVARGVVIRMKNDATWPNWQAEKK